MLEIPANVKHYLENEAVIPLVEVNGTKWYYISKKEKETLANFVMELDRIPENVWRKYPENIIRDFSYMGNLADRVVRNSITREG